MIEITKITEIGDKRHIALLDTSSISFMQGLSIKGLQPEAILNDYDLLLIPEWVLTEINDAPGRADYVQKLIDQEYPIFCIEEVSYTDLANNEEGNWWITNYLLSLFQIKQCISYFSMKKNVHRPELLTRTSVYFYAQRTVRTPRAHIELKILF